MLISKISFHKSNRKKSKQFSGKMKKNFQFRERDACMCTCISYVYACMQSNRWLVINDHPNKRNPRETETYQVHREVVRMLCNDKIVALDPLPLLQAEFLREKIRKSNKIQKPLKNGYVTPKRTPKINQMRINFYIEKNIFLAIVQLKNKQ